MLPANNSRVEPEGIGAFVTNSTLALLPLLVPDGGLLAVSESRDTVVVTWLQVVLPTISPNTIVATTEPPAVYTVVSDVTPATVTVLNVFAIFLSLFV